MKTIFLILGITTISNFVQAQYYTHSEIQSINNNRTAGEGDLYLDTINNIQYIGITSGALRQMGNNLFNSNGQLSDNRMIDGDHHNFILSNIDSSKIESNTIELNGDIVLNNLNENENISRNVVIDSEGKLYTRPVTQAQSDIILIDPSVVTVSGSGYRTFHEFTLPGGTFGNNNVVRITLFIRRTSGSGSIKLRVEYDGDIIAQMPSFNGNNPAKTEIFAFGAGSSSNQRAYIYHSNSGSGGLGTDSSNKNSNNDLNIKISGDLSTNSNQWTCDLIMVEAIR